MGGFHALHQQHLLHLLARAQGAGGEGRQLTAQQARGVDEGYLQARGKQRGGGGGVVAVVEGETALGPTDLHPRSDLMGIGIGKVRVRGEVLEKA